LRASLRLFEIVPDDFILSASLRFALTGQPAAV
jgi:hypothetical protein